MCGRFTLTTDDLDAVAELFGVTPTAEQRALHRPRFNVAPTDEHWFVRSKEGRRELLRGGWGLLNPWDADPKRARRPINARLETAAERPSFRDAWRRRRCIVPADGFFEWEGPRGRRRPLWFFPREGGLLHLAGLHATWRSPEDEDDTRRTFTILTTVPDEVVAPVHDRMPLLLLPEQVEPWLAGALTDAEAIARPARSPLGVRAVSPRVSDVHHDDPDLLDPADPRVATQLDLFA